MASLSKLEIALMLVPPDLASVLVAFGADQASIWMGQMPKNENEFYFEMGRRITRMTQRAWEKEFHYE